VKRRERNQNKSHQPQIKNPGKKETVLLQWIGLLSPNGKIAAATALFLTVVGSYYAFSSKLAVEASPPIESTNLFTAPFVISNDGILPINSVTFYVIIRNAVNKFGGTVIAKNGKGMQPISHLIPTLQPGEKTTTGIPNPFGDIVSGDIDLVVTYRPLLLPFEQEKVFRFGGSKESDGKLVWRHRAASE
jgi:hypothetical protein